MKEKIKKILLYDGLDTKEEYESVVADLKERNRKNMIIASLLIMIFFTVLFFISFVIEDYEPNRYAYLVTMAFSSILFLLFITIAKKNICINTICTYIFLVVLSAFAIIIGTINETSEPAISFNIILVLIPFWTYDKAIRSLLYRVGICIVYFVCVFKFKDSSVVWTDVMDALVYGSLGTLIGFVNQKINTSAYYLRNNMKKEIDEKTASLEALTVKVVTSLTNAIDAKDEYTNGHSTRVAKYARMIAVKAGMTDGLLDDIYYVALLHDVGKIGVPDIIINKPTKLTDEEYDIIKKHPEVGYGILQSIDDFPDIAIGALSHHERFDGKGYPKGLLGEQIPEIGRIIAVADSYDAMTSNRSYRKYMPQEKVREEIEKGKGTQFDPVYADIMLDIIDNDKEYELHE